MDFPVWKKLETLSGCATHGRTSEPIGVVKLNCDRMVPSSSGPQLSSTPSLTPE